ncbi:hypothetical protein A4A49_59944, partial [Nicotiana attenuata]
CKHIGNMKHTKDICFKLDGYPQWWHELKAKRKREAGRAALVNTGDSPNATTNIDSQIIVQTGSSPAAANISMALTDSGNLDWIIDSGVTDRMTFDLRDCVESSQPKRTCIANANGVTYPVIGAGKVALSPSFSL